MNKTGRVRHSIPIESKIQKAQDVVLRTKTKYEKAMAELERLIEVRREVQRKEIMAALEKSERSFEDVMRFLRG